MKADKLIYKNLKKLQKATSKSDGSNIPIDLVKMCMLLDNSNWITNKIQYNYEKDCCFCWFEIQFTKDKSTINIRYESLCNIGHSDNNVNIIFTNNGNGETFKQGHMDFYAFVGHLYWDLGIKELSMGDYDCEKIWNKLVFGKLNP